MKGLVRGFFIVVFVLWCGKRKRKMDGFGRIREMVDWGGEKGDRVVEGEVKEEGKGMEGEEVFDDFMLNYGWDDGVERERRVLGLGY